MSENRLLIIDDEVAQLTVLRVCFESRGIKVYTADSGEKGLSLFRKHRPPVVISDLRLGDMSGIEVLHTIKEESPETEIIIITAYGDVELAVEAVREGAADFILKPLDLDNIVQVVRNGLQRTQIKSALSVSSETGVRRFAEESIITNNRQMEQILATAELAAHTDATILIRGESGTGKELLARAIRDESSLACKPFITVNCAALNENLLESELFGHRKGSFTGAIEDRVGRFEEADGGTVFLDEIGDLPLGTQVKLLRVLQEGDIQRVGDNRTMHVDIRMIAATNQDLEHMLVTRTFREDLYYRLNVIPLWFPPLRERTDDIELLSRHFLKRYADKMQRPVPSLSTRALKQLMAYEFPGNVRELENILQRSLVFCTGDTIDRVSIITQRVKGRNSSTHCATPESASRDETLPAMLERIEKESILFALDAANGIQARAAEMLGLTERQMRYRMKKLELS